MRDPETFETRLTAAYRRYADEVGTGVDPMALAHAIAMRPVRTPLFVPRFPQLRLAVLLGLLAAVAVAAAVVVGGQPSPVVPAPASVSNGWIAFAANPGGNDGWLGEFRDIYLTDDGGAARRIIGSAGDGRSQGCPGFSPDGTRLAYGEGDESIRPVTTARGRWPVTHRAVIVVRLDAEGQPSAPLTTITLPTDAGLLPCPEWSSTGTQLAFLTGPELWVADAATGATTTFPVEAPQSEDMEWSPDGSAVAVNEPGRIRSIPIDGSAPTVLPVIGNVHSLDWAADGQQIVYFTVEDAIRSIAIADGQDALLRADGYSSGAGSLAVSPDGSKLAYLRECFQGICEENPLVVVVDIDGSNETVLNIPPVADLALNVVSGVSWSPDGQRLLLITKAPSYELVSVAATPGIPLVVYPSLRLSLEWVDTKHLSWQPLLGGSTTGEPTPSPRLSATARPSPSTVPSVPPAATPAASPATIGASGTTETAIGQISWTKVQGDASNVPFAPIFDTLSGFAAIEPDLDRRGSRFWVSADGVDWVIAPMPVPAAGVVGMGQTADEHWIWSQTDFRLWRSSDFATWTEVDLGARTPPPTEGVDWRFSPSGPVTVGATTLLPWRVVGTLALDELLGIPLAPGEMLSPANRGDPKPAPGERDIYRGRGTSIGSDEEGRVRVGSIRVEVDDSIVTVFDADRDIPVARIDATTVGIPAADLAGTLEEGLYFDVPGSGVVIEDGDVQGFVPPPGDITYLDAREGRFVALTEDDQGIPAIVWTSTNGLDWESLGPPVLPLSSGTPDMGLLERSPSDPGEPLTAAVLIDEAETQRLELWSSGDGQTWAQLGLVYTYPGTSLNPMRAPIGYLATGDDFRVYVSATGAEWSMVDGPEGVGQSPDEVGGVRMTSSTSAGTFTLEAATDATRTLWVFTVDPAATPSP